MLTRARKELNIFVNLPARLLVKLRLTPNTVTLIGLAIACITPILSMYRILWAIPITIALSAYMDALDGYIARLTGRVTKFGAILDSFSDRVEEFLYLLSFMIAGVEPMVIAISMTISFSISYLRAIGELRGIPMEGVGLLERGERIILILISSLLLALHGNSAKVFNCLTLASVPLIALIFLGLITVIQRLYHIYKSLKE